MLELNRLCPEDCVELEIENKIREYMVKLLRALNQKNAEDLKVIPVIESKVNEWEQKITRIETFFEKSSKLFKEATKTRASNESVLNQMQVINGSLGNLNMKILNQNSNNKDKICLIESQLDVLNKYARRPVDYY